MVDDPLQHLSRAAGLGAYVVLWLDMCLGVALTGRVRLPLVPRWRIGDLHQFTGTIGLGLLCTHIAVLTALQQQAFSPAELFTPFLRQINPAAPVLGISGLYAMLIVSVVSRARRHIGMRTWRMVHTLSFAAFALSLAHAITAGPDASADWVRAVYIATVSTLLALTIMRIQRTRSCAGSRRQLPSRTY